MPTTSGGHFTLYNPFQSPVVYFNCQIKRKFVLLGVSMFAKSVRVFFLGLILAFVFQIISSGAFAGDCEKTYENFGKAFVTKYCIGCHSTSKKGFARNGAPKKINFDSFEKIKAESGGFQKMVVQKKKMPPMGGPTQGERAQVATWLKCEAK
jgi:uncharacterized membrane protein